MYCYNCGKKIEGRKFCPYCGAEIITAPARTESIQAADVKAVDDLFSMNISDAFTVSGKGLVLDGIIKDGNIHINQEVCVSDFEKKTFTVLGLLNKEHKRLDAAQKGDFVSVLIGGAEKIDKNSFIGKVLTSVELQNDTTEETINYDDIFSDIAGQVSSGSIASDSNGAVFENKTSIPNDSSWVNLNIPNKESQNTFYPEQNALFTQNNQNPNMQSYNLSAIVGLRTGKGITVLSVMNQGKLNVTPFGVSYSSILGSNHTYSFNDIAETKFTMTHVGLQPVFAYTVTLKNGTDYIYMYSPLQKAKMQSIDATIHQNMH